MKINMDQRVGGKDGDLLIDDLELLLREIREFCGINSARGEDIPKILDDYLLYVSKTGNIVYPWQDVRQLFRWKLQSSISSFSDEPLPLEGTIYERFDTFRAAPFTIQRFSELITNPKKHYKLKEKFLFALEKTVYVVSTVDPEPVSNEDNHGEINGNGNEHETLNHEGRNSYSVPPLVLGEPKLEESIVTSFPVQNVQEKMELVTDILPVNEVVQTQGNNVFQETSSTAMFPENVSKTEIVTEIIPVNEVCQSQENSTFQETSSSLLYENSPTNKTEIVTAVLSVNEVIQNQDSSALLESSTSMFPENVSASKTEMISETSCSIEVGQIQDNSTFEETSTPIFPETGSSDNIEIVAEIPASTEVDQTQNDNTFEESSANMFPENTSTN